MRMYYYALIAVSLVVLQGCSSVRCDKIKPYQKVVAGQPLDVPADLSEPTMRGESPELDPNAPTRREDGACLESPPPFEPEEGAR